MNEGSWGSFGGVSDMALLAQRDDRIPSLCSEEGLPVTAGFPQAPVLDDCQQFSMFYPSGLSNDLLNFCFAAWIIFRSY